MKIPEIEVEDVQNVAKTISQDLTDVEIKTVIERYPAQQDQDKESNWSQVIEDVIYQVTNERK